MDGGVRVKTFAGETRWRLARATIFMLQMQARQNGGHWGSEFGIMLD